MILTVLILISGTIKALKKYNIYCYFILLLYFLSKFKVWFLKLKLKVLKSTVKYPNFDQIFIPVDSSWSKTRFVVGYIIPKKYLYDLFNVEKRLIHKKATFCHFYLECLTWQGQSSWTILNWRTHSRIQSSESQPKMQFVRTGHFDWVQVCQDSSSW